MRKRVLSSLQMLMGSGDDKAVDMSSNASHRGTEVTWSAHVACGNTADDTSIVNLCGTDSFDKLNENVHQLAGVISPGEEGENVITASELEDECKE